jgi:amino acid transporter
LTPVAGSVFQWTKYLAGKTYSWFAGWIYLFAGILTVTAVCVTLPLALIPAFNLAVGAVYYGLVQRTKPSHMDAPEGEVFAQEAAPEQSAPAGA